MGWFSKSTDGFFLATTTPPDIAASQYLGVVNGEAIIGANAWEWTDGGTDSARPTRGGSWWYGAAQMHRDHVQTKPADTAVVYIGFRCAKSLPSLELK